MRSGSEIFGDPRYKTDIHSFILMETMKLALIFPKLNEVGPDFPVLPEVHFPVQGNIFKQVKREAILK